MKFRILTFLSLAAVLITGCATGRELSQKQPGIPALAQENGRIYFYRPSRWASSVRPTIRVDGQVVGKVTPGSFFFVDRPPGHYRIEVSDQGSWEFGLTLDKGQTRYLRVAFPRSGPKAFFEDLALMPIALPIGIAIFHVPLYPGMGTPAMSPTFVDDAVGQQEIGTCRYNGSAASARDYDWEIRAAATGGDLEQVNALLKDHPDLASGRDDNGDTPLHFAADGGHADVVELLLSNKAEVNARNSDGWTPLHEAACSSRMDVVELLLASNAEVNSKDNKGHTPLHYAAANGHDDVVALLRRHGGHE